MKTCPRPACGGRLFLDDSDRYDQKLTCGFCGRSIDARPPRAAIVVEVWEKDRRGRPRVYESERERREELKRRRLEGESV